MKGSRVLTIGIALVSTWAVAVPAAGNPAMWQRRILSEHDDGQEMEKAA